MTARPRASIIIVSDTRSSGAAPDLVGGALEDALRAAGWGIIERIVVADERAAISAQIVRQCDQGCALVLTSGGTGLGPRDVTPEATSDVIDRVAPGIPELFRVRGADETPMSWLSRAMAGLRGDCLVVNLPGSPRGASSCLQLLLPLLDHAQHVLRGGGHD